MQRAVQSQMESGMRCLCDYFNRMSAEAAQNPIGISSGSSVRGTVDTQPASEQNFHSVPGSGSFQGAAEDAYDHLQYAELAAQPAFLQSAKAAGRMVNSGGSHVSSEDMSGLVQGLRISSQPGDLWCSNS